MGAHEGFPHLPRVKMKVQMHETRRVFLGAAPGSSQGRCRGGCATASQGHQQRIQAVLAEEA